MRTGGGGEHSERGGDADHDASGQEGGSRESVGAGSEEEKQKREGQQSEVVVENEAEQPR